MESHIQGVGDGGGVEMVIFFGEADPRAAEDNKRFKLSVKNYPTEPPGMKVLIEASRVRAYL
jgi:hypothetical protein